MKKRMFIALDIAHTDKVKIAQWREQHLSLPFRAIKPENFHITLAFLGLIDDLQHMRLAQLIGQQQRIIQQQLTPLTQSHQPQSVTLSKIGYFKRAQVLHLMPATSPDWLLYLNKHLVDLCLNSDIALEDCAFQPHLSLYRKAKFDSPARLTELQKNKLKHTLSITSFSLYHSYSTALGVCYEPVQTWPVCN